MIIFRAAHCVAVASALALLPAGCEPDDPKIRQEVAELRAKVAELEKKGVGNRATASAPAASSASDSIPRETLRRNLEDKMPALRAALARAFPDYRVDPVNAATVSTPQDSDYLPYSTEVTFGLSRGQGTASFSIRIGADRAGNWQLPDVEDLAASVGNLASQGGGSTPSTSSGISSRGAGMGGGTRQVQWPEDTGARGSSSFGQSPAESRQQEPQQTRQPAGSSPFPVQETRTIEFD